MSDPVETVQNPLPAGRRIVFLDALRFVAASAVVFQHIVEREGAWGSAIVAALSPGVFGVVLFFIISGFVIPMAARGRINIREFAIRRIFRVYPLVIATFLLLAVVGYTGFLPSIESTKIASMHDWIANLLLIDNYVGATPLWGVTWTLSLEVAWYTLFAVSLLVIGPRFDDWLSLAMPVALLVLAVVSLSAGIRLPLGRVGLIYAAILGCRIYRSHTGGAPVRRVVTDLLIFVCVMTGCNALAFGYFKHPNITVNQAIYPWIAAPLLFGSVAMIPAMRHLKFLNSRIIGWLGSISFSTYLLHGFAVNFAHDYSPSGGIIIISVLLTILLSAIGYYYVELPGQRLGRWVTGKAWKSIPATA